ncbi:MAG: hypothetical protein WBM86_17370 [Waterburya sp.]
MSHYENIWCFEGVNFVFIDLPVLINRLFTAILLVLLLFACQKMPENRNVEGIQFDHQAK